jgi:hypothetical protein
MTLSLSSIHKNIWFTIAAAFAILITGFIVMHAVAANKADVVTTAFLMDMVITFPLAYYLLIIRPFKQKLWRIMLVITCCCGVAYLIMPAHQREYIIQLRKLTAGLELGMLVYCISKIRHIKKEYRRLQADFPDVAFNMHKSMAAVMGDSVAVKIMASELSIVRFGLLCFKKEQSILLEYKRFSVHKESGYAALFGVIVAVCFIEMVAFHLFLMQYSHLAANIVTILSVYGTIFITGDFSALVKSPVLMMENRILLRTGLRWRALVDLDNIASAQKVKDSFEPAEGCFKGGIMKNSFNMLITFNKPVTVERLYRKPTSTSQILMSVDDADRFLRELTGK